MVTKLALYGSHGSSFFLYSYGGVAQQGSEKLKQFCCTTFLFFNFCALTPAASDSERTDTRKTKFVFLFVKAAGRDNLLRQLSSLPFLEEITSAVLGIN